MTKDEWLFRHSIPLILEIPLLPALEQQPNIVEISNPQEIISLLEQQPNNVELYHVTDDIELVEEISTNSASKYKSSKGKYRRNYHKGKIIVSTKGFLWDNLCPAED